MPGFQYHASCGNVFACGPDILSRLLSGQDFDFRVANRPDPLLDDNGVCRIRHDPPGHDANTFSGIY